MQEALTVGDLCLAAKVSSADVALLLKIDESAMLTFVDMDVSALEDGRKRILFEAFKVFARTTAHRLYNEAGAWDAFVRAAAFIKRRDAAGVEMKPLLERDAWQRRMKKAKAAVFQDQLAEGDFPQHGPQKVRHSVGRQSEEDRRFWRKQGSWKRHVETYKRPNDE